MAQVECPLIVSASRDRSLTPIPYMLEHGVGVYELDGKFGKGDKLGFTRGHGDAMLSAGAAIDAGAGEEDDETCRGTSLGPIRVGTRAERVSIRRVG